MEKITETMEIVWAEHLIKLFETINNEIAKNIYDALEMPHFEIFASKKSIWGSWDCERRIIAISADLFLHYEKKAVEFILRHEMAHQIVDEIFYLESKPHGELFKKACEIVKADPKASLNQNDLENFASNEDKAIISKIKKIMAKGNCESASEAEATIFLKKAQKLLMQYNLSHQDLGNDNKVYICRPVGKLYKSTPGYYWPLATILENHYFVKTIRSHVFIQDEKIDYMKVGIYKQHFMLFGEPSNLDIAEYIWNALDRQADNLWNEFKKSKKALGLPIRGLYSKKAFIEGIYDGYNDKLTKEQKHIVEKSDTKTTNLVTLGDPYLKEAYRKEFPDLITIHSSYSSMSGYNDGFSKGQNLKISKGVNSSKSKGKYLT